MKTERMTLEKWYGSSIRIPTYSSHSFPGFIISSLGIVRSVVQDVTGNLIRIGFMMGGTAYADQESKMIRINDEFLNGLFLGKKFPVNQAIEALLGIVVHEAAHFAYSPADLRPYTEYVEKNTTCIFHKKVAATIGNILEDIFIEARVDRDIPSVSWMIRSTNEIFFSEEKTEKMIREAEDIEDAPTSLEKVGHVLNFALLAKTKDRVSATPYLENLFHMAHTAVICDALEQRLELALAMYQEIMRNITFLPEEGSDEGVLGEASVGEAERNSEGLTSPHSGEMRRDFSRRGGAKAEKIEEALEDMKGSHILSEYDEYSDRSLVYMENPMPISGEQLEADQRYGRLAEVGRQKAVVNRPYGQAERRGHTLRRLHRIATDGRIFAEPISIGSYKPMQVIILIDCSGSMECVDYYKDGAKSRIERAGMAALGAALALAEARCDVAIYGHTGNSYTADDVQIHRVKSFSEGIDTLPSRMHHLVYSVDHRENFDGYAVQWVSKKFTTVTKRRVLIVISDGAPLASGYSGTDADKHAKKVADQVRASGIDLLSISIAAEARRVNDYIYGKEYNVCNDDPNVIEEIIKSLVGV